MCGSWDSMDQTVGVGAELFGHKDVTTQGHGCWQEGLPVPFFIAAELKKSKTKAAPLLDQQPAEGMWAIPHDV